MNISIINVTRNLYSSSKPLTILSYFLMDDIGARKVDSLINWLQNDEYESVVLNYSFIKKKGNNKVNIYCFYDGYEREEHEDRYKFEIEIDELIRVAKEWQELYKKYLHIRIMERDNKISLQGSSEKRR